MLSLLFLAILSCTSAIKEEKCGKNEVYTACGGCDGICDTAEEELCIKECRQPGSCGCIVGYKRNKEKVCSPMAECGKKSKENVKCGENEEMFAHGACDGTCLHPHLACALRRKAKPECGCKQGYVRDDNKKCIKTEDCKE